MDQTDARNLIATSRIPTDTPTGWADLGCGSGVFTRALASLLAPGSTIYAIDKGAQSLASIPEIDLHFIHANFEKENLELSRLDGILMANSLHYIADPLQLVLRLKTMCNPCHRFLIVEYDTMQGNQWVPYPLDYPHLQSLFTEAGYHNCTKLATRPSVYHSAELYAALME